MTKLWLEEGGKRRVFRLGSGLLSVGSGAGAKLRVESGDVAEVHFELELGDRSARVLPRRGVLPPRIAGRAISGPAELAFGKVLEFGAVRLWLESEAPAAPASVAPGAERLRRATPAHTPIRRRRETSSAEPAQEDRPRRAARRGPPMPLAFGVALVAIVVVAFVVKFGMSRAKPGVVSAAGLIDAAAIDVKEGNLEFAEERLAEAEALGGLGEATRARIAGMRTEIRKRKAEVDLLVQNDVGTNYFETMLKKYEAKFLAGEPDPVKARLFIERCREFRRRWPGHPQMDWVERQEARFRGVIDLSQPKTWPEVEWELEDLSDELPRNYVKMLALLDEFIGRAEGRERSAAEAERAKHVADRPAYHLDRLQQARYEFEQKEDPSKAVWWLVHEIIWIGDPLLADEAAQVLLAFPRLEEHLAGYKQKYPDRFAALLEHDALHEFARSKGLAP